MRHQDAAPADRQADLRREPRHVPVVDIAPHGVDGSNRAQPREDVEAADISGVQDALDARQPRGDAGPQEAVRVCDETDAMRVRHATIRPVTSCEHASERRDGGYPMQRVDYILFSGGAPGAEAEFGAVAERYGIEEVNFTFEGHSHVRQRGLRFLNHEELLMGDVSLEYISKLLSRRYADSPTFRKVLQSIWFQINNGQEIYVIGTILDDGTVKGGTGWGAEFAKLCNKPLSVFDQDKNGWFGWSGHDWKALTGASLPVIGHAHVTGTGTRVLNDNGRAAIAGLFERSFT
jgi:hypothetical protein